MSSPHQVLLQSNETSIFWHCLHLNPYRNRFIRKVRITVFRQFNFPIHNLIFLFTYSSWNLKECCYIFLLHFAFTPITLYYATPLASFYSESRKYQQKISTLLYMKNKVYMYEVISDWPPSSFTLRIAVGSWTAFTEKPEKM